jgi:hypothetical protein
LLSQYSYVPDKLTIKKKAHEEIKKIFDDKNVKLVEDLYDNYFDKSVSYNIDLSDNFLEDAKKLMDASNVKRIAYDNLLTDVIITMLHLMNFTDDTDYKNYKHIIINIIQVKFSDIYFNDKNYDANSIALDILESHRAEILNSIAEEEERYNNANIFDI